MGHEIGVCTQVFYNFMLNSCSSFQGWVATNPEPAQKLVFRLEKNKWKGNGQYARLPEHYKQRAIEHLYGDKEDVHDVRDKRKFIVNHETGVWYEIYSRSNRNRSLSMFRTRTQHVPVTVVPTVQADKGLWGGEGVVIGYEDGEVKDDYQ